MKKKTRPNGFIYQLLRVIAVIIVKLSCRFRADRSEIRHLKGGYMLLFNHHSNYDFLLSAIGLGYRRVNYVVSSYFYRNKLFSWILNVNRCIPKDQFKPDLKAIRGIRNVVDGKGIVAIAPSGQVSINGEHTYISPSIVKLVRLCKTDVVAMVIKGAHLAFPKWRKNKRRGLVEAKYLLLIRKEELDSLSDEEIYQRIVTTLDVNDYDWQREGMHPLWGKNMIEGLDNILYHCLKCGSEFTHVTHGMMMECKHCGNKAIMDRYGFLNKGTADSVIFDDEVKWYHLQKDLMKKELKNPAFEMKMKVQVKTAQSGQSYFEDSGSGELTFDRQEIIYRGTLFGENTERHYSLKTIMQLPFAPARHLEIPNSEAEYLFQPIENKAEVIKWVIAVDVLNDERQITNNEE